MSTESGPSQLSVDNILNDVYARRKTPKSQTKVDILDIDELREYQGRKRTEFESYLKRNRLDMGQWLRYAAFEQEQHDMRRARSVFERALLVNATYVPLWIHYIDAELKSRYLNHARNLLDRAITTIPRVDKLWYKYLFLEESLENWEIVRSLYNKWCSLEPERGVWVSYVEFEMRQQNWNNVRGVYEKFVLVYPEAQTWLKWVDFESTYGSIESVRNLYSLAVDSLISYDQVMDNQAEYEEGIIELVVRFAEWETTQQEYNRAKEIFHIALQKWPHSQKLIHSQSAFERNFGNSSDIERSIINKRRISYENDLKEEKQNIYKWMQYLDLIIQYYPTDTIDVFEMAVNTALPKQRITKDIQWERYIYLWIRYVTHVELESNKTDLCDTLYKRCLNDIIPHQKFTFSIIWIMYSEFAIRQDDITKARKILGRAIGLCPTDDIFRYYIQLETRLREFDRVRKIYEKYLQYAPDNINTWEEFAQLENNLGDEERARSVYEIALNIDTSTIPETTQLDIIRNFIEFEVESQEYDNARNLYEAFLKKGNFSPNIWIAYATFECSAPTTEQIQELYNKNEHSNDDDDSSNEDVDFTPTELNFNRARKIYERGLKYFKEIEDNKSRYLLMEAYGEFEKVYGNDESRASLDSRKPRRVIQNRNEGGVQKEYVDYVFPEDSIPPQKANVSRMLALAQKWKKGESQ